MLRKIIGQIGYIQIKLEERDHERLKHAYEKLGEYLEAYKQRDAQFEQWVDNKEDEVHNDKSKL